MLRNLLIGLSVLVASASLGQATEDPTPACLVALSQDGRLKAIQDKIAIVDAKYQTLDMLSNDKKPTKNERSLISLWATEGNKCIELGAQWRLQNYPPTVVALFNGYVSDLNSLGADLYSGKIAYGTFAKKRAEKAKEFDANAGKAVQEYVVQQQALDQQQRIADQQLKQREEETVRQNELAQRQEYYRQQEMKQRAAEVASRQAIDIMRIYNETYKPIQLPKISTQPLQTAPMQAAEPIRRQSTTNCRWFFDQLQCTTN